MSRSRLKPAASAPAHSPSAPCARCTADLPLIRAPAAAAADTYPSHHKPHGYNAIEVVGAANCWVRDVKVVNSDNAISLHKGDFHTVTDVTVTVERPRWVPGGQGALRARCVSGWAGRLLPPAMHRWRAWACPTLSRPAAFDGPPGGPRPPSPATATTRCGPAPATTACSQSEAGVRAGPVQQGWLLPVG